MWGAVSNASLICWDSFFPPSILLPKWRDRVVYRQRWLSPIRRQSSGKLAKSFFPTPRDVQSSLVWREKLKITRQFDCREIVTSSSFIDLRILAKYYSYRVSFFLFIGLILWMASSLAIQSNSSSLSTKEKSQRERRIGEEPRNNNPLKVYGGKKEKRLKHDDSVSQ